MDRTGRFTERSFPLYFDLGSDLKGSDLLSARLDLVKMIERSEIIFVTFPV